MKRTILATTALLALTACGDGEPLFDDGTNTTANQADNGTDGAITESENDTEGDGATIKIGTLPPGTDNPTRDGSVVRYQARDGEGDGLVTSVSYDAASNTLLVDNIAFDGENVYKPDSQVRNLGDYAVFEADLVVPDFLTGENVLQTPQYRALLGASANMNEDDLPRSSFTIVRNGHFLGTGFGGYVYARNAGAVLPDVTTGQATFTGPYAGLRNYENQFGLEYIQGDMRLDIDFGDFNANNGVKGGVSNRQLFDIDGNYVRNLTDINWEIVEGANTVTEDGEIVSKVFTIEYDALTDSYLTNLQGQFNGVIVGDTLDAADGGEIVGVIDIEGPDLDRPGVVIHEVGGGILYRKDP